MKVGILGHGQLARMLALAGIPLDLEFAFFNPTPVGCVAGLGELVQADFSDHERLIAFAEQVDVVTVENENIPESVLTLLEQHGKLFPASNSILIAQDRLLEKQFMQSLDIPVPRFYAIDDQAALVKNAHAHGGPLILKTRRLGYDGKGQFAINHPDQATDAWQALASSNLIAEERIPFKREVSLICVRNRKGEMRFYPLSENIHQHGILMISTATENDPLQSVAEQYAQRILDKLDYVGVMGIEFFDCDGELLVNEIAPRVHNTGHWTIEGALTSQFENHLRAILDLPLGATEAYGHCVMYNLIGELPDRKTVLDIHGAHLHNYGKEPRPGRKLGHITLCHTDQQAFADSLDRLRGLSVSH